MIGAYLTFRSQIILKNKLNYLKNPKFYSRNSSPNYYWNDKFDPNESKFKKILIANRGEIACRVIGSCKRLGIASVAVHSDVDTMSRHARMADEAICIGPALTSKSYLNMDAILDAVRRTGAEAVHPGYGFLSENTVFAKKLEDMGVVFLGPNSKAIQAMGDKIQSKRIAKEAKVSCIPGFDGEVADPDEAVKIAREIGYPVMIKASAGGGGKGMRFAWNDKEAHEGFRLSKGEALSNFGDDRMLIEKYIDKPRHIEMQIMCDRHGNALYLFERECSIQRRNQKVIEEAPSTFLDEKTRRAMGEQATMLAKAVGYDSAGTVEFLVDSKRNFYFLEMNTRLQVEHPITEAISGVDIVHQMFRSGRGHHLLYKQDDLRIRGWAVECRVYAEDPYKHFGMPSIGRLTAYREPSTAAICPDKGEHTDKVITHSSPVQPYVRCDSGIQEGSEISIYYDSMICKLVTYGANRQAALDTMVSALDNYVIRGVVNNIPLLRDIVTEDRFVRGDITTNYLKEVYPAGFQGKQPSDAERERIASAAAIVYAKSEIRNFANANPAFMKDKLSKREWDLMILVGGDFHQFKRESSSLSASESSTPHPRLFHCRLSCDPNKTDGKFSVATTQVKSLSELSAVVKADHKRPIVDVHESLNLSDLVFPIRFGADKEEMMQLLGRDWSGEVQLQYRGTKFSCDVMSRESFELMHWMNEPVKVDMSHVIVAPMPGLIKSISVEVGQKVSEGQEVCVLEAMKMQNSLVAAKTSVIKKVNFKTNQTVGEDDVIIELE